MAFLYDETKDYKIISFLEKHLNMSSFKTRLQFGHTALSSYSIRLFGNQIIEEANTFWIDNFFIRALLKYGVVIFASFMIMMLVLNINLWKKHEYFKLFILTSIPIVGISEALIGDPFYNVFPIVAIASLSERELYQKAEQSGLGEIIEKVVFSIGCVVGVVLIPQVVSWGKTFYDSFPNDDTYSKFICVCLISLLIIMFFSLLYFAGKCFENMFSKEKIFNKYYIIFGVLIFGLLFLIVCVNKQIDIERDLLSDEINNESDIIRYIDSVSENALYAEKFPEV